MNKKLSRLFSTNLTVYFTVMVLFCLVSWFRQNFVLAVVESIVTVGLFIYYKIRSARRKMTLPSICRTPASQWTRFPTRK